MNRCEETVLRLIDGVRVGDRTAFSDLLASYRPLLVSRVSSYAQQNGSLRDELLQDATLALYRAALCYRAEAGVTFGAYARVCITNALNSAYRKHCGTAPLSLHSMASDLEADGEDPAEILISQEETGDIYAAALACLSPYEMRVFLLYIHGYTPRAIAPEVGRSEKSVSNAIGRMLKKLRARLH